MQYQELIKNIKILLADDDADYLAMTGSFLKQIGYNVDSVSDGNEAAEKIKSGNYQIALLDYYMPGLNGEEVVSEVRKYDKEIIIILQTGFSGQKPPVETMQRLNIQNYFDKTEGIDKLNLELISAVKIFSQQNEIELSKYRTNMVGKLVDNIAEEIKSDLLSISAGIEVTNMLTTENNGLDSKEVVQKMRGYYEKNKATLERIDKILNAIISELKDTDNVLYYNDIMAFVNLIIKAEAQKYQIDFITNTAIKSNSYITGDVNHIIFVLSELLEEIILVSAPLSKLELTFTEDDKYWILTTSSKYISKLNYTNIFVLKQIISTMDEIDLIVCSEKIDINILKK